MYSITPVTQSHNQTGREQIRIFGIMISPSDSQALEYEIYLSAYNCTYVENTKKYFVSGLQIDNYTKSKG